MSQPTPGEWYATRYTVSSKTEGKEKLILASASADIEEDERMANLNLAAASKDMKAALKTLLEEYRELKHEYSEGFEKAQSVYAKHFKD